MAEPSVLTYMFIAIPILVVIFIGAIVYSATNKPKSTYIIGAARYSTAWFCVSCNGKLTDTEVMYSNGRCPLCGYKDEKACTIVSTKEKAVLNFKG